jgi:6,7-dimethyl-8-ribityllumazine synthase
MSGAGAPSFDVSGMGEVRVAIIASSWHDVVMGGLIDAAVKTCASAGVSYDVVRVPGSFELGVAAMRAAKSGVDAIVALGVVIRGGTPHFDYVCTAATDALNRVALDTGVPVGFGLLTCDTEEQALERAGLWHSSESKGQEAAEAALITLKTLRSVGW